MIKKLNFVSDPILHISSSIDTFQSISTSNVSSSPDRFLLDNDPGVQQVDRSELGFLDREKIDRMTNSKLPLVIAVVLAIQTLTGLLVDEEALAISFMKTH